MHGAAHEAEVSVPGLVLVPVPALQLLGLVLAGAGLGPALARVLGLAGEGGRLAGVARGGGRAAQEPARIICKSVPAGRDFWNRWCQSYSYVHY